MNPLSCENLGNNYRKDNRGLEASDKKVFRHQYRFSVERNLLKRTGLFDVANIVSDVYFAVFITIQLIASSVDEQRNR